jgi:hypothetical protein
MSIFYQWCIYFVAEFSPIRFLDKRCRRKYAVAKTIRGALVAAVIPTRAPYREQFVSTHTMFERLSIHTKQIP